MDDEATGEQPGRDGAPVVDAAAPPVVDGEPDEAVSDAGAAVVDAAAAPVVDGEPDEAVSDAGPPQEASPAAEIIDLPWDDDLPVALGDDSEAGDGGESAGPDEGGSHGGSASEGDDPTSADGQEPAADADDDDRSAAYFAERRRTTARSVSSWRNRSATGAIATAIAMGLQQVFEPEKRRPAAVAEAPSDPYDDDDPITVDYVPDDAEATTVHVKPWLLQKGDPA